MDRRRQQQLALAERRAIRREHRAASARARFQPGLQWRRWDHGKDRHRVPLDSTTLAKITNTFVVSPTTSALGLQLMMSGAAVTVGQFGNWTPIGAEQAANGTYQAAWKNGAADQYLVWSTDGSGNWLSQTGVMSGSSSALKAYESAFKQDLNQNGMIDVVSSMISSSDFTAQIASASSATVNVALLTSYMASAFATPAGEGTGAFQLEQSPAPLQLTKPLA